MTTDSPVWDGDLDDDCSLTWRGYGAHAEAMGEREWYCSVWRLADGVDVFHSTDADVVPLTGPAARRLCELVIRAAIEEARP